MTHRVSCRVFGFVAASLIAAPSPAVEPGKTLTAPVLARWTAAVWYTDLFHNCSASLIDRAWVLTARHCLEGFCDNSSNASLEVYIGSSRDPEHPYAIHPFDVEEIVCPVPGPTAPGVTPDDVALIRIRKKFGSDWHRPTVSGSVDAGPAVAVGWVDGSGAVRETAATIDLVPRVDKQCTTLLAEATCGEKLALSSTQFCASGDNASGSMYGLQKGDSGGPLVQTGNGRPQVVGVASAACSKTGVTVYEDVSEHRDWIVDVVCDYYAQWGRRPEANCRARLLGS